MKAIKKISYIFLLVCLVFTCISNVYCAINVRAVKTGDVIYFDNTDTNWDKVRVYFYSSWGGSEVVSWANSLEMKEVSDGIYALEITSDLNIESHNVNMLVFNNGKDGNSNQSIDLGFIDTIYAYKFDTTESNGKNRGYWYVYDKSELKDLYDEALTYEEPYYTTSSYSELEKQIEISKNTLENEIRLGEVQGGGYGCVYITVVDDLRNAINNLVLNKELLKNKIDEVKEIELYFYTEDTANEVTNVLTIAEEKYNSSTLTVQDIKDQIKALDDAVDKLRADKTLLIDALKMANEVLYDNAKYYTQESVDALKDSIDKGNDIVSDDLATPDEVRYATSEVEEGINNLVFNRQLIKDLISKANARDFDKYTDESVEVLKNAVVNAETLLNEALIYIPEYEKVEKEINDAIDALVKKDVTSQTEENYTENTEVVEQNENPTTGTYIGILSIVMIASIGTLLFTVLYNKKMRKNN